MSPVMEAGPALLEHLRGFEVSLAHPDTRRSPAGLAAPLADDFRELGGSGGVHDKEISL